MSYSILVVDDEEEIREMLGRHFSYLGYDLATAINGRDALDKLSKRKIDIVISDIMMPEINGVELLRQIRLDYPMIHSIMITGYVTLDNALACMRYGADACIFKPINDLSVLERAVTDATQRIDYWIGILKELRGMKS